MSDIPDAPPIDVPDDPPNDVPDDPPNDPPTDKPDPEFPKHAFLIILNEFCERFSYYGMKAVLCLYLKNVLHHSADTSTILYHTFCTVCYFMPLFGGTIADSWLGKYKTILYLSIVYTLGNATMSLGAITIFQLPQEWFAILGLLLIACGMGGIKPCVSAFGGDQFKLPEQQEQLTSFFSIFYFFINIGSLISMVISPILRKSVKCFELDTCYPLSFGLSCVLMIISIVLLASGTSWYTRKEPQGNMLKKVCLCIYYALAEKLKQSKQKDGVSKSHWLDYADSQFSSQFIEDLKQLFRVVILFIPASMFWALFDQQGSRWTFQATEMNGKTFGFMLKPDQMQLLNPLLMLPLIVLFHKVIYPFTGKFGWLKSQLQRMTVGGVLVAFAFLTAGIVQLEIDKTCPENLLPSESRVNFISNVQCSMTVDVEDSHLSLKLDPYGQASFDKIEADKVFQFWLAPSDDIQTCNNIGHSTYKWESKSKKTETLFMTYEDSYGLFIFESQYHEKRAKNGEGIPLIRFAFLGIDEETGRNSVLKIKNVHGDEMNVWIADEDDMKIFNKTEYDAIPMLDLDTPTYRTEPYLHLLELHIKDSKPIKLGRVYPEQGGNYLYVIAKSSIDEDKYELREYIMTPPNSIHMIWLIPQYFLLTTAEVMFSISGCDFAFNEAPNSMKSLFQAMWLLTVAFGNIIVIILTELQIFEKQFEEFFMYSAIMFIAIITFAILASKYQWRIANETDERTEDKIEETGQDNVLETDSSGDNQIQDILGISKASFFRSTSGIASSMGGITSSIGGMAASFGGSFTLMRNRGRGDTDNNTDKLADSPDEIVSE